jgi:hypothetical protein
MTTTNSGQAGLTVSRLQDVCVECVTDLDPVQITIARRYPDIFSGGGYARHDGLMCERSDLQVQEYRFVG